MKTWKLVSGILSIMFSIMMLYDIDYLRRIYALTDQDSTSLAFGFLASLVLLACGIVSISVKNSKDNGGNVALIIMFGICILIGRSMSVFTDTFLWMTWCAVCAGIALASCIDNKTQRR